MSYFLAKIRDDSESVDEDFKILAVHPEGQLVWLWVPAFAESEAQTELKLYYRKHGEVSVLVVDIQPSLTCNCLVLCQVEINRFDRHKRDLTIRDTGAG